MDINSILLFLMQTKIKLNVRNVVRKSRSNYSRPSAPLGLELYPLDARAAVQREQVDEGRVFRLPGGSLFLLV